MSAEKETVGLIGLGAMGFPIAVNLLAGGYDVLVFALPPSPIEEAVARGARRAPDAAGVAAEASVILTSLPDGAIVREALLGERGVVSAAAPGAVVIELSTISPAVARQLATELAALDIGFLDAPVSGGVSGASAGTLSIMVGGDGGPLERARPVLETIGSSIIHCGPAGAGQVCKACNQLVVMANLETVAEALVLGQRNGLDPAAVRRALLGGFASSTVLEQHGQRMIARDFEPGGKAVYNLKDIEIVHELARESELELPVFDQAAVQMRKLIDGGGGDLDNSAVISVLDGAH